MNAVEPFVLDVREALRNGAEPLPQILGAVKTLKPGQPLSLFATFEPLPLYAVLGRKGYGHSATRLGEGDWEVLFTPGAAPADQSKPQINDTTTADAAASGDWPEPTTFIDNRGLEPPEPLVRILDALEHLGSGEVLEAINERDPVFLYPELESRGAAIRTEKRPDGDMRLLIRHGV